MGARNQKPRIFIASAFESFNVADAVNFNLDHDAEVTVWKHGFEISSDNISSLLDRAWASDFAVFIFTPDDVSIIRQQEKAVVRDNVLFELGLFVGSIGKDRCFIVKPIWIEPCTNRPSFGCRHRFDGGARLRNILGC